MKSNGLASVVVIAILVNAVGIGLTPLASAAATQSDHYPTAPGTLPAEHTTILDHPQATTEPATYTDRAGTYRFEGLPHGTHKVTIDPATLPLGLRPPTGEPVPTLWLTPGLEQTSAPLSTGVRFTAAYDRPSSTIAGVVFLDEDGDGRPGARDLRLSGVRVVDPTLHQYFVPFDDRNLWTLYLDKDQCYGFTPVQPLVSYVFLTSGSDGTTYYYDHWEDDYDTDPLVPGPTTEVGVLDAGATRLFQSNINPALVGGGPPYYYDGRDRITIFGEEGSVVRLAYPTDPGTILASAWEVSEAADWGTYYVATAGEDLAMTTDHQYAGLEVMAWVDGTDVYYNGTWTGTTLNAGETYFVRGGNNGAALPGANSTDIITATAPIQVQMMTGSCQGRGVSANGYTLQPVNVWDNAYWAPVPGFAPACGPSGLNADTDIYLHNHHLGPITVAVTSGPNTANLVLPSHTTVSVLDATGWADLATGNQATFLSASDTFWGLVVVDSATNGASQSQVFDWGFSLVPVSELSSQAVVGYAPGNGNPAPLDNGNLAFVTAITDTVVYVDLSQDGLPDAVDLNGDGDRNDYNAWGVAAWDEPTSALGIPLMAGQVLRVGDPADRNLMGARIYTLNLAEKIAVAWGQDPCRAASGSPYLDLGYTVLPVTVPRLSKVDALAVDADLSGGVSPGDTITYTLVLNNNGTGAMTNPSLTDNLPYTYTEYIVGSLRVTTPPGTIAYSNDGVNFTAPENPGIRALRVTWPNVGPGQTITATFRIRLLARVPVDVDEITNRAVVNSAETGPRLSEDPDDPADPDTDTPVQRPLLAIDKSVSSPTVRPGDRITYTLVVSNDGNGVALLTAITDTLPAGVTYVPNTLGITWPVAQVEVTTRSVTETTYFHGNYADDFDLTVTQTTNYSGNDGSLAWSADWTEFNDPPGAPAGGEVQVQENAANALSDPAYLYMIDNDGDDACVRRTADLAAFRAPVLRYYPYGASGAGANYRVEVNGANAFTEQYNGDWTIRETSLIPWTGGAATIGLCATGAMGAADSYRFDNIAIYESDPQRVGTRPLNYEVRTLNYLTSTGGNPASYNPVTGHMVITEGMRLPAGGVITVTFQAQVASPLANGLMLGNTACTTSSNWIEILSPPCEDAAVQVQSSHALTVTKTATPSLVAMGGYLTYTIHYAIAGDEAVESMVVSDTTPLNTTFYSAAPTTTPTATLTSAPAVGTRGPVIWRVSGLWPPGTGIPQVAGMLQMVVRVNSPLVSGTLIYNAVTISDTTALTDTDEITTPVQTAADMAISKRDNPDPVIPGSLLTYTLEVVNHGPNAAEAVVVNDTLPPEVSFNSATPLPASGPNPLVWNLGTIAPHETRFITVVVQVQSWVTQTFTNTAWVDSDTPDPDPGNNRDDEQTRPPTPDLELIKTVVPSQVTHDIPFTCTLQIINTGDFPFTTLRLTDNLPTGFRYVVGSGRPRDPDAPIVEPVLAWSNLVPADPFEPGASLTVTFQVTTSLTNGTYTNTATVEGMYLGGTLTDTDDAPVSIVNPRVAVEKLVIGQDRDADPPNYVTFTISISNVGSSNIAVLPLLDRYDTDYLKFRDATPYPEDAINDGLLTWYDLTGLAPYGFRRDLPLGEAFVITTVFEMVNTGPTINTAIVTGAKDENGYPADDVEDDELIDATPIELLYFRAVAQEPAVRLEWATAAEVHVIAFRIYRAVGTNLSSAQPIAYIPAAGPYSTYSHLDRDVILNQAYWYWLAEVSSDHSEPEIYGPVWGGVGLHVWPYRLYLPLLQKHWAESR